MSKRVTRAWLLRAGIASAVGAVAVIAAVTLGVFSNGSAQPAQAAGLGMTVVPVGGGVYPQGSTFTVHVVSTGDGTTGIGGYTDHLTWPAGGIVMASVADVVQGPASPNVCPATWGPQAPTATGDKVGCFGGDGTAVMPSNNMETFTLHCNGVGTQALTLAADSTFFDASAVNITTTLTSASVTCTLPVNKADDSGGTAVVGQVVNYAITIPNSTGVSIPGNTLTDVVPAGVGGAALIISQNGNPSSACTASAGAINCSTFEIGPGGFTLLYATQVAPSAAGTTVCNTATLNPGPTQSVSNNDCFNVPAAGLTVTKTADAGTYQAGDPISWTITVNSTGVSDAVNTIVTDTAADGFDITGSTGSANCTANPTTLTSATFNCGTLASSDGPQVLTVSGTVHDPQPSDNTCNNTVSVTSDSNASATASASANCLSKNVRMVKSDNCSTAPTNSGENVNLFLGNGPLTICEWALNVGGDPQGVGAFEFDVSYDNRVFDIAVAPTGYLWEPDTAGRVPDLGSGAGGCAATIITENDVRFGCVSKDDPTVSGPPAAGCGSPDLDPNLPYNTDPVPGIACGATANGVIATITVTPKADLIKRLTPGNDNGIIRTLVDSGCEFADIWGHPLSAAGTDWNGTGAPPAGIDNLGREIPLPGIAAGGQVTDCADLTVTVRILEGDMNTDCNVDVTDDQLEASHYGATFGSLLYDPWYDLEPALKDFDVDIKDLQKVFGRNGSTCANPIPPQNPQPQPGDP